MNEVKIFSQGGLNYDTELHLVPAQDWIDAFNIRMSGSDEQHEAALINIEGNIRIGEYAYHSGDNKCIGAFSDELRNVVYAFIANELQHDEIIEINIETGMIVPIFKNMDWTGNVDVLQFDPQYKIPSIDIIHRDELEGDLMFWTDGLSAPRKINILKSKNQGQPDGYPSPILYSYTTVIKEPPRPVVMEWGSDLDRVVNNTRGKLFQFQARYVYSDYEKSVWSSWSNFDVPVIPFAPDRDSDPTINNFIELQVSTGNAEVSKIELCVRQNIESGWGDGFLMEIFDKEELGIPNNSIHTYRFYNDNSGAAQPPEETDQLFDYVPYVAGAQALVNGDTIAYGDIVEGIGFDEPLDVFMSNDESVLWPITNGENVRAYKHSSKYKFGLVYFDEYNRTDGVHVKMVDTPNRRLEVDTTYYLSDSLADNNYNIFIPKISVSVFHRPPEWAYTYKWVRTSYLSVSKYLYYIVRPISTPYIDFIFVPLDNLTDSITDNGNKALSYDFVPGDRMRFVREMSGNKGAPVSVPENMNIDLEITTLVDGVEFDGTIYTGKFLKVRKNTLAATKIETAPYLVEIYTPSNISNKDFYYEFGPEYQILNAGTPSRRHQGQIQDQTITLSDPARFEFITNGDVYLRRRDKMDQQAFGFPKGTEGDMFFSWIPVTDPNYSDKYASAVNGNGRAYVVDEDAKSQRLPSAIRFSNAYIQNTFVNKTNNFPPENIVDIIDRSFGAIRRLSVRDRQLRVFQELKCGWIPVKQQVLQTGGSTNIVSQSDKLLNDIQYYEGDFGIGNAPCSLASKNFSDYFHDTNRGVICRLSLDGVTPISITSKMNRWALTEDVKYKSSSNISTGVHPVFASDFPGAAQIYGVFDGKNNEYISAYEELAQYDNDGNRTVINEPKTLSWSETANRFGARWGYYPEWMVTEKNNLITFKNGIPYIHSQKADGGRCIFYDEAQPCYISLVFNDKFTIKKTFETLDMMSNQAIPAIEIKTSIINPSFVTLKEQVSNLVTSDYEWLEDHWHAAFLRDLNSPGGIADGDTLKGSYLKVTLNVELAQNLISLYSVGISYIISQKNNE